jgi:hypothetical protein
VASIVITIKLFPVLREGAFFIRERYRCLPIASLFKTDNKRFAFYFKAANSLKG